MKIVLSGNLKRFADFEAEVEVEATTIPTALGLLVERYPKLRPVIHDGAGGLRKVHRLFVNGEVLSAEEVETRELGPQDELGILTALAGG
jgi:sulfur-carrier protein